MAPPPVDADDGESNPCAAGGGFEFDDTAARESAGDAGPATAQLQPGPGQPGAPSGKGGPLGPARKPLLIYTATLHLAVFRTAEALDAVEQLARDRGGYLVSRTDNTITVRVPAELFHASLDQIAKFGVELHRNIQAQDVTAEFRDLEIRLANLVAVRERLAKLLAAAKNVEEALAVERELERVTGQIEQIKGRLKLLSELVAFSTITATFQAPPAEKVEGAVDLPFPWLRDLGLQRLLRL